jgi:hypothetical protein
MTSGASSVETYETVENSESVENSETVEDSETVENSETVVFCVCVLVSDTSFLRAAINFTRSCVFVVIFLKRLKMHISNANLVIKIKFSVFLPVPPTKQKLFGDCCSQESCVETAAAQSLAMEEPNDDLLTEEELKWAEKLARIIAETDFSDILAEDTTEQEQEENDALLALNAEEQEENDALLALNAEEQEENDALLALNAEEQEENDALLALNAEEEKKKPMTAEEKEEFDD